MLRHAATQQWDEVGSPLGLAEQFIASQLCIVTTRLDFRSILYKIRLLASPCLRLNLCNKSGMAERIFMKCDI
jgi:hypothetical protein